MCWGSVTCSPAVCGSSSDRLRLTIELTDTQLGAALWFSKLDERFADLFEVQDRLSDMIVRQVAPHLHAAEMNRIRVKRPDSLEAYELFLRAQENMHNSSRAVFETSQALFDAAIAKDPHYAAALAWRARWHVLRVGQGWSPDPADDTMQADRYARAAIECNSMEPMAFAVHGHVASYLYKDFDLAFQPFRDGAAHQRQCRAGLAVERRGACLDGQWRSGHRRDQ